MLDIGPKELIKLFSIGCIGLNKCSGVALNDYLPSLTPPG